MTTVRTSTAMGAPHYNQTSYETVDDSELRTLVKQLSTSLSALSTSPTPPRPLVIPHQLPAKQEWRSTLFPDVRAAILAALDEYDPSLPSPVQRMPSVSEIDLTQP